MSNWQSDFRTASRSWLGPSDIRMAVIAAVVQIVGSTGLASTGAR